TPPSVIAEFEVERRKLPVPLGCVLEPPWPQSAALIVMELLAVLSENVRTRVPVVALLASPEVARTLIELYLAGVVTVKLPLPEARRRLLLEVYGCNPKYTLLLEGLRK